MRSKEVGKWEVDTANFLQVNAHLLIKILHKQNCTKKVLKERGPPEVCFAGKKLKFFLENGRLTRTQWTELDTEIPRFPSFSTNN